MRPTIQYPSAFTLLAGSKRGPPKHIIPPPLVRRFQKWPADALAAVALKFLTEMELDANTRSKLVGLCQAMHTRITQASEGKCGEKVWSVGGRGRGTAHA